MSVSATATPATAPPASGERSLIINKLRKEYRAGQPVLRDVSLEIESRGLTAIIGPSGTGKSTLIRCINRLVEPTSGEILFRGQDIVQLTGPELRAMRRHIGMIFQEYNLVERLSVIENVLCGRLGYVPVWRAWLRKFPAADIERAFTASRRGRPRRFRQSARRPALRRTASARRHRARADAGARSRSGRRADLLARSQDLGRDHGADRAAARPSATSRRSSTCTMWSSPAASPTASSACRRARSCSTGRRHALKDSHLLEIYGGEGWLE